MKKLLIGIFALGSITSFANCSFKITQNHRINDCESALGRNCYKVPVPIIEELVQVLKGKGYTVELSESILPANLEIDLAIASRFIPGPPYRGVGSISITYVDHLRNDKGSISKDTEEMSRRRMFKKLEKLANTIPELVSGSIRECL